MTNLTLDIRLRSIRLSRVVLKLPHRPRPRQGVGDIGKVRLCAHDRERLCVDLIHAIPRVETGQGRDARSDVGDLQRLGEVDLGRVAEGRDLGFVGAGPRRLQRGREVVVEKLQLVLMRVPGSVS